MKKVFYVFVFASIYLQGCVAYRLGPTPINEAYNQGNAKVVNEAGQEWRFKNIEFTDSLYYGIDKKKQALLLNPSSFVYLQDIQKSKRQSLALGLGLGLGIPLAFLLSVFIAALIYWS